MKEIAIGFVLGVLPGFFLHIAISKYDKKERAKASCCLFVNDIEKSQELLEKFREIGQIASDSLSIINDWKKELENIISVIDSSDADLITRYYILLDELKGYQTEYKIALEESGLDFSRGRMMVSIPRASSANRAFVESVEIAIGMDLSTLIDDLRIAY